MTYQIILRLIAIALVFSMSGCAIHGKGDSFDEQDEKIWVQGRDPKYVLVFDAYLEGEKYYKNTRSYDAEEVEGILVRGKRVIEVYKKGEFYPSFQLKKEAYTARQNERNRIEREYRLKRIEEEKIRIEKEKKLKEESEKIRKKEKQKRDQMFNL